MDTRPLLGLAGVVVAVAFSEMNDQVVGLVLPDIAGGLGLGQDAVSWFRTLYLLGYILGAVTGPSLAVVFSPRRFLLGGVALACVSALLTPLSSSLPLLYTSRVLQGVGEGAIISNLIAVALRVLPPAIRLYGLVFYALTATVIPALSTTVAALWTDVVEDWRFVFLQSLPLAVLAALLLWVGMPKQPPQLGKLKTYDWPGVALAATGFGALAVLFGEGERFDWFNSPTMSLCALAGAVATPLFIWRELRAESPLMGLHLLARRNLLYPATALVLFIVIGLSASQVPVTFLEQVQGYRPEQAQVVTLVIALSQFVLLPLTARLLDFERVDARMVGAAGLLCITAACVGGVTLNSGWNREQFFVLQALQAVGQPLVVMPLLMIATNSLTPEEGPFGAALVNAPRALAEALGAGLLTIVERFRGALHRTRILETLGDNRVALEQAGRLPGAVFQPGVGVRGPHADAVRALDALVRQQATTLVTIDTYVVMAGLALLLLVLQITVPERTYPPRIALAAQG